MWAGPCVHSTIVTDQLLCVNGRESAVRSPEMVGGLGTESRREGCQALHRPPLHRTPADNLLTTTLATPNSSRTMNAAMPSGPKASGILVASVAKVPT